MAIHIHQLRSTPAPDMQARLAAFEREFDYPLGADRRFVISHGEDYPRFFRTMGDATCLLAEDKGGIVGTLAMVTRRLLTPAGHAREVTYLADLKIAPAVRGGFVLKRLALAALSNNRTTAGYSVVMRGTKAVPEAYTNRIGIPAFRLLGTIDVLRIPVASKIAVDSSAVAERPLAETDDAFFRLSQGAHAVLVDWTLRTERGSLPPAGLLSEGRRACGVVEDTLSSKRLFLTGGDELRSAHLSNFAFADPVSGAALIRDALRVVRKRRLPAMFTAVPSDRTRDLLEALKIEDTTCAPADVYGVGLDAGLPWNINTSEI
jgi:hypothetical protein